MQSPKKEILKYGNCQFLSWVSQTTLKSLMTAPLKRVLEKNQWNFGDREYKDLNAKDFFQCLSKAEVKILWLDFNKKPSIIPQIITPQYPNLTVLYLGDNNINSIEPLIFLQSPQLQNLYLNHNKITSIQSLRKIYIPKIKEINLNGNLIIDQHWFQQCEFPDIQKISLGYGNGKNFIFEQNWYVKAGIKSTTQISSFKGKLAVFNRNTFVLCLKEAMNKGKKMQKEPVNLFKTFQN